MNLTAHDVTAEDGTRLRVWEDAPGESDTSREADEAVLFVHGAITNSRALFAPPVEGDDSYSWLRATAAAGRTAYALDVRGYGESERLAEFDDPPEENDPPVRAETAATDVATAFDFAAERHEAVHVVGVSWGTMTCGRFFADRNPDAISLTQCAPVYDPPYEFETVTSAFGLDPDLDAYIVDERETVAERQDAEENPQLFDAVWRAMVESGQGEATDRDDAYVAQTGSLADVKACCAGDPPYDPGEIATPSLVVRGSADETSRRSDALSLYDDLGPAGDGEDPAPDHDEKEYAEIAGADHYAMHGERRATLYALVSAFQDRA